MSDSRFSRRELLERAGALGTVPLVGTLMAAGPFQAKAVPQIKGKAKSVVIPTHEFAGPNTANRNQRQPVPLIARGLGAGLL